MQPIADYIEIVVFVGYRKTKKIKTPRHTIYNIGGMAQSKLNNLIEGISLDFRHFKILVIHDSPFNSSAPDAINSSTIWTTNACDWMSLMSLPAA